MTAEDRLTAIGFPSHPAHAVTVFRDRAGITLDGGATLYVYPKNKWSLWRGDRPIVTDAEAPGDGSLAAVIEAAHAKLAKAEAA